MNIKMPEIHIYGANHSPWCQAVLLTLHIKGLKYTLNSLLEPRTIQESYRTGQPSPVRLPAMWYDGHCIYESINIIEFLDAKHPNKPRLFDNTKEEEVQKCLKEIPVDKVFSYALTRVAGTKQLQFWYEWSILGEKSRSIMDQTLSRFFRPPMVLYFWTLINFIRFTKFKNHWPESSFLNSISIIADNFKKNGGKYLLGNQITYLDILMMGHFQCMFSGSNGLGALSKEVVSFIDQHPSMWEWLKNMHQDPLFDDYPYMYTRCDATVLQRTGGIKKGTVPSDGILGQLTFWFGVCFWISVWPFTLMFLFWAMGTRMWKNSQGFKEPQFRFRFLKD